MLPAILCFNGQQIHLLDFVVGNGNASYGDTAAMDKNVAARIAIA